MLIAMMLMGCATTAEVRLLSAGGAAGEVYLLADTTNQGIPAGTVLLRCVEVEEGMAWTTRCHRYLTGEEAVRAAIATGATTHTHQKQATPGK